MATRYRSIVLMVLGVLLTPWAHSQPAREESVRELMKITRVQEMAAGIIPQIEAVMRKEMQRGYDAAIGTQDDPEARALVEEFMDKVTQVITETMNAPEFFEDMVTTYSSVYTEEEIRAQINFYSSKVGQKVIARTPELMQRGMASAQQRMPELQAKLTVLMKDFQARCLELKAKRLREQGAASNQ